MRAVVHSFGHRRTVKVGAKADVIRTGQLHHVINVIDDFFPGDVWQLPFRGGLLFHLVHFLPKTLLVVATLFFELIEHRNNAAGYFFRCLPVRFIDETFLVINLDDAALRGEGHDHVVGHVARMVTDCPARRM